MPGMKIDSKSQGRQRLQEERLRHGWTQQDVANRVGTTVVNVSRWERGVTSPGPYFRQQLGQLFAKDEEALGLLSDEQASSEPEKIEQTANIIDKQAVLPATVQAEQASPFQGEQPARMAGKPQPGMLNSVSQPPPLEKRRGFTARKATWVIGISAAFLLLVMGNLLLFPLIYARVTSSEQHTTASTPAPGAPRPILMYSFEDGGTDGWTREGHIIQFQNSNAVGGYDGTRALQIVFSSRKSTDLPYISVNPITAAPHSGETLSAALFVPPATTTTVAATLYVQDMTYAWHISPATILSRGKWNVLRFVIPAFAGPGLQVGIQFLSTPLNVLTTIYADDIEWW